MGARCAGAFKFYILYLLSCYSSASLSHLARPQWPLFEFLLYSQNPHKPRYQSFSRLPRSDKPIIRIAGPSLFTLSSPLSLYPSVTTITRSPPYLSHGITEKTRVSKPLTAYCSFPGPSAPQDSVPAPGPYYRFQIGLLPSSISMFGRFTLSSGLQLVAQLPLNRGNLVLIPFHKYCYTISIRHST